MGSNSWHLQTGKRHIPHPKIFKQQYLAGPMMCPVWKGPIPSNNKHCERILNQSISILISLQPNLKLVGSSQNSHLLGNPSVLNSKIDQIQGLSSTMTPQARVGKQLDSVQLDLNQIVVGLPIVLVEIKLVCMLTREGTPYFILKHRWEQMSLDMG